MPWFHAITSRLKWPLSISQLQSQGGGGQGTALSLLFQLTADRGGKREVCRVGSLLKSLRSTPGFFQETPSLFSDTDFRTGQVRHGILNNLGLTWNKCMWNCQRKPEPEAVKVAKTIKVARVGLQLPSQPFPSAFFLRPKAMISQQDWVFSHLCLNT